MEAARQDTPVPGRGWRPPPGPWYNPPLMTGHDPRAGAASPPEAGAVDGVHLREGRLGGLGGLEPPGRFLSGALYSIYPRAFSREGTLAAIVPALDRIAALGATAIWLLPIHPIGVEGRKGTAGSPYSIRDYRKVDPALGTLQDLKLLVEAAHRRGLAVILDYVANHAANDPDMPEARPDWFTSDAAGRPTRRHRDWSDVSDWRHDAPGAADYLVESALFWVREAGVDGFRCDVAGMVPRPFWRTLHRRLEEVRPGAFLLAEWEDAELHTIAFHASYDWMLYRALRDVVMGRCDAGAVGEALTAWQENFPGPALPLRFLENHDYPRAVATFGRERLPACAAVTFLSGGLPLLYNGQEVGAVRRPSLFEPDPIDWSRPGDEYARLYRELIALQRAGDPWGPGPARVIPTDRPREVAAFVREGVRKRGLVVANLGRNRLGVLNGTPAPTGVFSGVLGTGVWRAGDTLILEPGEAWVGEAPRS